MSIIRPIRPEDIEKVKKDLFPDAVIEAFNETIATNYHLGISTFQKAEVVKLMMDKGLTETDIYKNHWLDVEEIYGKRWDVEYDGPGFNESFPATFTFKKKRV